MAAADTQRQSISPTAKTAMLIRRPVAEVFEAFVDPAITANFWFTRGSGRLEPDAHVRWDWEMYGFTAHATVRGIERHRRILVEWGPQGGPTTAVEWLFTARSDGTTFVEVANSGFRGDTEAILAQVVDSTGGFTFVLAGLKAWLEHGIRLNLVADRHPDGFEAH